MRKFGELKIAVAGTGYVGLSIATLLAQKHQVTAVDVIPEKVEKINNRISPIQDEYIEKYLSGTDADGKLADKTFFVGLSVGAAVKTDVVKRQIARTLA